MDVQEAAQKVREHWHHKPASLSPEDQHTVLYLIKVCHELGLEPNPMNIALVAHALEKAGVPRFTGDAYPKAVYDGVDRMGRPVAVKYPSGHPKNGQDVVFANAEEEAAFTKSSDAEEHGHRRKAKGE